MPPRRCEAARGDAAYPRRPRSVRDTATIGEEARQMSRAPRSKAPRWLSRTIRQLHRGGRARHRLPRAFASARRRGAGRAAPEPLRALRVVRRSDPDHNRGARPERARGSAAPGASAADGVPRLDTIMIADKFLRPEL